jgi:hypothetical protein
MHCNFISSSIADICTEHHIFIFITDFIILSHYFGNHRLFFAFHWCYTLILRTTASNTNLAQFGLCRIVGSHQHSSNHSSEETAIST